MDLGIAGRWALVCASSKGLGKGCAQALAGEGVNVVLTARGAEALEATAAELRALNPRVEVRAVAGDIATEAGRAAALAAREQSFLGEHHGHLQARLRPSARRVPGRTPPFSRG